MSMGNWVEDVVTKLDSEMSSICGLTRGVWVWVWGR